MEHVNCWCFRGIYKGGLWEDDLHVSALVGLANGKPCRCYYTCDHMIFMKWVISMNNMTVM